MRLPVRYRGFARDLLGIQLHEDGLPVAWPEPRPYPPPGFLPMSPFQLGNGDCFGLYWPLGKEEAEPIVCELWHDGWALDPCAVNLEGLVAFLGLGRIRDEDDPEIEPLRELAEALGCGSHAPGGPDSARADDLGDLAPPGCIRLARDASAAGRLPDARALLRRSLDWLPEHGGAWASLAAIHRREGDLASCANALVQALASEPAFPCDRGRVLRDLQRLPDDAAPELRDDPLWRRRARLTWKTGQKTCDDYPLIEEAISEYLAAGHGLQAVRLRLLHGGRMARETTAFQGRYAFTPERHLDRLRADLLEAGLAARLPALGEVA